MAILGVGTEIVECVRIAKMIEAHGGMQAWAAAPTVSFQDEFRTGKGQPTTPAEAGTVTLH